MIDLFSCPEDGLIFFKKLGQLMVPSIFLLVGIFIEGLHTVQVHGGWEVNCYRVVDHVVTGHCATQIDPMSPVQISQDLTTLYVRVRGITTLYR